MAKGRTISASFLTDLDSGVIDLCEIISEYIRDTIDGIRTVCKAPTLLLAMGNRKKHIRTAYGRSMITPQKMAQHEIDRHLQELEDTFQLPAIEILSETGQQRLVETVIQYFSAAQPSASIA